MEKRISYQQFQSVKSVAKAIDPIQRKLRPTEAKIKALAEEYKGYQAQIEALEAGILQIIGFHVSDLVKKVMEPTGATDKNGKPIMGSKYLPTDMVSYDEQKKQYVITVPEENKVEEAIVPPTTEEGPGSDFDADVEASEQKAAETESAEDLPFFND